MNSLRLILCTAVTAASFYAADALAASNVPLPGIYTSNNYIVSATGPLCQGAPGFPPLPPAGASFVSHLYQAPPLLPGSVEYLDFVDTQTPDPTQNNSVILKLAYPAAPLPGAKTWTGAGTATIFAPGPAFNFPATGVPLPFRFSITFSFADSVSFSATDVTTVYADQAGFNANQPICTITARATHVYSSL